MIIVEPCPFPVDPTAMEPPCVDALSRLRAGRYNSGMKPKLDHFGALAPIYENFIAPKLPEKLIQLLDLPAGGTVLDAGGGTGRVAQFLRGKAAIVVVADQSLKMLCEARKKEGLQPVCSNAEQMPFGSGAFDSVLMVDALHHVMDQTETAAELWRILKPGGRIVIEEPDIRVFGVKLLALGEKLALMRSHFLSPPQIARKFPSPDARVRIETKGPYAWVVIEKNLAVVSNSKR